MQESTQNTLQRIFKQLDEEITLENSKRIQSGATPLRRSVIKLLGQMSLAANKKISAILHLNQTADLDAFLEMDGFAKNRFCEILKSEGLIYDEDSPIIWIPEGARFENLFTFKNVLVKNIDPESALVSKAIKAPQKNVQLIREAIASNQFPSLIPRIIKSGGNLEFFAKS